MGKGLLLFGLALSACQFPTGPSAEDQSSSVYKVEGHTLMGGWSGTAWVVQRDHGRSYLLTAGHVCNDDDVFPTEYVLKGADGTDFQGARSILDDDDLDLCLLGVPGDLGDPIPLADSDPDYGSQGHYVGAPLGMWGGGIAGFYPVWSMGRGQVFHDGRDALAFSSAQAQHGASGSPIIFDGRAVAVLTLGMNSFMTLTTGVPWNVIDGFLVRARHRP